MVGSSKFERQSYRQNCWTHTAFRTARPVACEMSRLASLVCGRPTLAGDNSSPWRRGVASARVAPGQWSVQFVANRRELPALELADGETPPAIGRTDHRGVHQLQHRPLAEGMGHDLRPAPRLAKQALQEVRGPDQRRHRTADHPRGRGRADAPDLQHRRAAPRGLDARPTVGHDGVGRRSTADQGRTRVAAPVTAWKRAFDECGSGSAVIPPSSRTVASVRRHLPATALTRCGPPGMMAHAS